jgi:hypothetical protein
MLQHYRVGEKKKKKTAFDYCVCSKTQKVREEEKVMGKSEHY